MSNQIENPSQISLEQLTEAAIQGTQRALAARPPSWWSVHGPLTIGFHFDQMRLLAPPAPPPTDGGGTERPDLSRLRTGLPLSSEATGRVSDRITQDRELGRVFARAISTDFAGTFEQLFQLTPEQTEAVRAAAHDRASTEAFGRALLRAFDTDGNLTVTLDVKDPAVFFLGIFKWSIKIHIEVKTKNINATVDAEMGGP